MYPKIENFLTNILRNHYLYRYLFKRGCNIHTINSFGCNAVLWCAQGRGDLLTFEWFRENGCNIFLINNNGHGVLHKAAQRGHQVICEWFLTTFRNLVDGIQLLDSFGPDAEGCCPSDLAGMEGHVELAKWLAAKEIEVALRVIQPQASFALPSWFTSSTQFFDMRIFHQDLYAWEKLGGVRRMQYKVLKQHEETQ